MHPSQDLLLQYLRPRRFRYPSNLQDLRRVHPSIQQVLVSLDPSRSSAYTARQTRGRRTDESDVRRITEIPLIIASKTGIYRHQPIRTESTLA